MTAAHCMPRESEEVALYSVLVNMHDVTNTTGVESIPLSRGVLGEDIIIHSRFGEGIFGNDIAFMILPKEHEVRDITYASINEDDNVPGQDGDDLRVIGWGRTSNRGPKSWRGIIRDGMLCAYRRCSHDPHQCTGPCNGDSGGPIMHASDEGDPFQVGIVSWSVGCAHPDYPAVYTRVSHYADWIKDTACAFTGDFCPTCEASRKLMLEVIVHTDNSPEATSWKVTNKCGSPSDPDPIMSGGPYPEDYMLSTYVTVACVPEGEYEFTIEDSYGDGNCCSNGNGYYSFQYCDEVAVGGEFESSETKSLGMCTTSPTPQPTSEPTQVTPTHQPTQVDTHQPTHQPTSQPQPIT
eukprot:scaffold32624_cov200-Skeletonema_menzelii.AAC.1